MIAKASSHSAVKLTSNMLQLGLFQLAAGSLRKRLEGLGRHGAGRGEGTHGSLASINTCQNETEQEETGN